jgi:MFS-type transporter involved in bile tolerance (Atg22 family)
MGAGGVIPFAALGAIAGRPLGDRLGVRAVAMLAVVLLATAGLYTLAASTGPATHQ